MKKGEIAKQHTREYFTRSKKSIQASHKFCYL